ncbi:MAG: hypothetical protein DWP98_09145 [Bacteroidetes bacterium]|nr:MAG: hypothetical protein DWP98_09145 [Bacteroidota bacterium]MBL1145713.1 hypothetical protein [Bacteroidota bacterium]MCB0802986.1 hypothetical protein [Flavobacteriales bacterium]NOG58507.1 hypothetical protein [Bacteroidota bacterium]
MKIKIITALFILLNMNFLYGASYQEHAFMIENAEQLTSQIEIKDSIILLNGEKWEIDKNMLDYIRKMEENIIDFKGTNSEEFNSLAKSIDKNTKNLVSNCSMTGQAHDELHKWLIPFLKITKEFKEAKSIDKQKQHLQEIQTAFLEFNTYFK